jgi:hypothetical protein
MMGIVIVGLSLAYIGCACADLAEALRAPSFQIPSWALQPPIWKALHFGLPSPSSGLSEFISPLHLGKSAYLFVL